MPVFKKASKNISALLVIALAAAGCAQQQKEDTFPHQNWDPGTVGIIVPDYSETLKLELSLPYTSHDAANGMAAGAGAGAGGCLELMTGEFIGVLMTVLCLPIGVTIGGVSGGIYGAVTSPPDSEVESLEKMITNNLIIPFSRSNKKLQKAIINFGERKGLNVVPLASQDLKGPVTDEIDYSYTGEPFTDIDTFVEVVVTDLNIESNEKGHLEIDTTTNIRVIQKSDLAVLHRSSHNYRWPLLSSGELQHVYIYETAVDSALISLSVPPIDSISYR